MGIFTAECDHCGSVDHATKDCPHGIFSEECRHCGSKGHATKDCPHGVLSNMECSHCGSNGHATKDCPHGVLSNMECSHCGSKGHATKDCPHGVLSNMECSHCGSKEHATKDCPHGILAVRREPPRIVDHGDSDGAEGLFKFIAGIAILSFVFWFITSVAIPFILINIASIFLLGGIFIGKKWSKVLFPISIIGAIILFANYNQNGDTSVLGIDATFFVGWIKPLLYLNLVASLVAAYLFIRNILNSKSPPAEDIGEFSRRNMITIGSLLTVGVIVIGVQGYVDSHAKRMSLITKNRFQTPEQVTRESPLPEKQAHSKSKVIPIQVTRASAHPEKQVTRKHKALVSQIVNEHHGRYVIYPSQEGCYGTVYKRNGCGLSKVLYIGGWGDYYYDFLQFNLSKTPDSNQISRAELWMWGSAHSDPHLRLYRVTQSWSKNTMTILKNPSSTFVLNLPPVHSKPGWIKVNITDLYKSWKNNDFPNYGIKLVPERNNHTNGSIASVYNDNVKIRPRLVLLKNIYHKQAKRIHFAEKTGVNSPPKKRQRFESHRKLKIEGTTDKRRLLGSNISINHPIRKSDVKKYKEATKIENTVSIKKWIKSGMENKALSKYLTMSAEPIQGIIKNENTRVANLADFKAIYNYDKNGTLYENKGMYIQAIADFKNALVLDPVNLGALGHLSLDYLSLNNPDYSLYYSFKALNRARYGRLYIDVASAYGLKGNSDQYIAWLKKATSAGISLNPSYFDNHFPQYKKDPRYIALMKKYRKNPFGSFMEGLLHPH